MTEYHPQSEPSIYHNGGEQASMISSLQKSFKNILPLIFILISFIHQAVLIKQISLYAPHYLDRPVGPDGTSIYFRFLTIQSGEIPPDPDGNFPLFLYLLLFLRTIFNHSIEQVFVPYLAQTFMVLLAGAFTYKIGTWLFSRNVGVLSCFGVLLYGRILDYALAYANAIPIMFFFTGAIFFIIAYQRSNLVRYLWIGSLFLALSALGRATTLIQIGVFTSWFFLLKVPVKKVIVNIVTILFVTVLVLAVPLIQNYRLYHQFVFVNTNGALNLFIGNNPESQGQFYVPPGMVERVQSGATTYEKEALAYITHQPLDWLRLMVTKLMIFFIFPWWRVGYLSEASSLWLAFWLGTIGISAYYAIRVYKPFRSLLYLTLIGYVLSIIVFFVEERFRIPILPVMFILLSAVTIEIAHDINNRAKWSQRVKWTLLAGGVLGGIIIYAVPHQYKSGQAIGEVHTPLIYAGMTLGQSFQSPCDNLYRIDVKMRSFEQDTSRLVTFFLTEGAYDGPVLYSEKFDLYNIRRANYTSFTFPNIPDSAGKQYTFFFDTIEIQAEGDGLIALVEPDIPVDTVKSGSALFNGQKVPGDLTFFAYCRNFFSQ